MATAKQCDICGKLYVQYNFRKDVNNPNGFMFLNLDEKRQYWKGPVMDCCSECMASIRERVESLKKGEHI